MIFFDILSFYVPVNSSVFLYFTFELFKLKKSTKAKLLMGKNSKYQKKQ